MFIGVDDAIVYIRVSIMCQCEKLRRAILYYEPSQSAGYLEYPIHQTAVTFDLSDSAVRAVLAGMADAGFIDIRFDEPDCARVRTRTRHSQTR